MDSLDLRPGRPFWTAFTAFFSNMVALLGLQKADAVNMNRPWLGALVASLLVAAAIYGRERLVVYRDERER